MKFHQDQNVLLGGVNRTDICSRGMFLFCFGKVKSLFLCLFGFFTQNVDILKQDLICYIALMFSKQNFKMYQYGCVQNWIFLDCHFMRNFNFFLVLIQWKNMPECQFLIWHKFCFSLNSNYSIWILKSKEAEKNRRQEQDVSKSPFVPPPSLRHMNQLWQTQHFPTLLLELDYWCIIISTLL